MDQKLQISPSDAGQRLDAYLAKCTSKSRNYWQQQIRAGRVEYNHKTAKVSQMLEAGDTIQLQIPDASPPPKTLNPPNLKIIYEDNNLLVINKPAGLLVHAIGNKRIPEPTVADFARTKTSDFPLSDIRPGIVHRLDRDTSGLLIVAKNPQSQTYLQAQFKSHLVKKTYLVLVVGRPEHDSATINLPLSRSRANSLKRTVTLGGKSASTHYKLLASYPGYSLLEASPESGRTHQLRVHFAHIGHPVAGDIVYGEGRRPNGLKRQFLHATKLKLTAQNGSQLTFASPLAPDLSRFLESINPS